MEDLISFIIPAYNNENTIGECIGSVLKQTCKKEIIVVDNGSTDRTRDIIERYPVKLLIEKKRGAAAARNRGLGVANGNLVAFVDADAVLPRKWCAKALQILKNAKEDVVGAGGPLLSIGRSDIAKALDALSFGKPRNIGRTYTDALNASGVMFDMKIFREIRFDENLIRGQDTELGFRIRNAGYKLLYDSELYVYHHNPTTLKSLVKKWFKYGKSYPLSYLKHRKMRGTWFYARVFFIPVLFLLIALSFIWTITAWIACLQLLILFFSYIYIGLQIPTEIRRIDVITFSFIQTIKQLAQLMGIWYGFFERMFFKPIG
ncbi:MAG: glycosyltransferase [Methanomassiliicoccales archaeon]|nr:MAG: glycosyltransferase [Methanomassiliicoccales archaeon]